jgi:biotin transport system substrate-specific component
MSITTFNSAIASVEERSWLRQTAIVLGSSIIISLFAKIAIFLPFTPVPIATQGLVILMLAALLGSKRGTLAVLAFICQGAMGLPVFSGGNSGLLWMAGPTGGYILGYAAAAFLTGWIMETGARRTVARAFLAMAAGNLTLFVFGMAWLAKFVGISAAFTLGMLPFVLGDFLKLVLGVKILKKLRVV